MINIIYEFGLILLGILALPKFLYLWIYKKKYHDSILQRLGFSFPEINKQGKTLIWVHAVSLGETKAISTLVIMMRARWKDSIILFSTTTETGNGEARKTVPADYFVYLPFDFSWVIKPAIRRIRPDLVILCESDFWLNFLEVSKEVGAKVAIVNGKISARSENRLLKIPSFAKKLFSPVDLFCVQDETYAKRFQALGVPSDKIVITGNLKFDGNYPKLTQTELFEWRSHLGIAPDDPVIVVGSTHNPEESEIIHAMGKVWNRFPRLKVILVPRHPERFDEVAALLKKQKIGFRRLSQGASKGADHGNEPVILIDAMGQLLKCYQIAEIAIVAGSYVQRVGGHNILEPCWYGIPVVYGPYMHGQPSFLELIQKYGADVEVPMEEMSSQLIQLMESPDRRKSLGDLGLKLTSDLHGATEKTMNLLNSFFSIVGK